MGMPQMGANTPPLTPHNQSQAPTVPATDGGNRGGINVDNIDYNNLPQGIDPNAVRANPQGYLDQQAGMKAQQATQPNIFQQSAGAYSNALNATQMGMNAPIQNIASGMSRYQNPYEQQVVDTTLQDLERQRQMQINDVGSSATAAGAFGGSRQGVMEAETNRAAQDVAARTAAQLRSQGFTQAANLSGQDIQNSQQVANRLMSGGSQLGSLSNLGFNMGNTLNQNQMQAGNQQQALMQALINAGRNQTQNYYNSPQDALNTLIGAYSGSQTGQQSQKDTMNPGLLNILTAGAQLVPGGK